jgi:limonene-1,2-epoxide hydrolase
VSEGATAESKIVLMHRLQRAIAARDKSAFLDFFAPDVEYHYHVGSRPLKGREWVEKFIDKYWRDNSASTWIIEHHAETGARILMEGREECVNASGDLVRHPYMGIVEFNDCGKIVGWRDYFQMADPNVGH